VSRGLALLLAAGAGCLVGMQAPVNSRLARSLGESLPAATISFLVGTLALVIVTSISKNGIASVGNLGKAPWWALIGGLFGAAYVTVAILTVRTLGASGLTAAVIGGQLAMSVAIDRFGLLGIQRQSVGASRILGLVLLVVGIALVVRR
jgi:bacterial/archaeal transporter family-2 protein